MNSEYRFEVMPFESVEDDIENFQDNTKLPVTTSSNLGVDRTVEFSSFLANNGMRPVPHLAARYVEDRDHLETMLQQLKSADVNDIFVPGGDRDEPLGVYESSHDLLVDIEDLGYEFNEVGITGYPEGHSFLSDEELEDVLMRKQDMSTYIVTQMCFDADKICNWIQSTRDKGVENNVYVGIPGVIEIEKMIKISKKIGVGESIDFLRKNMGVTDFVKSIVGSRGRYDPNDLINELEESDADPSGYHVYTFNRVERTVEWYSTRET